MVAGDQWPVFLYEAYKYDSENPWTGLLRSSLLVAVHILDMNMYHSYQLTFSQAFKHIFTSPSSVHKESSATRSGNARLHGMASVTSASIAYVATQACDFTWSCFSYSHLLKGPLCAQLRACVFKDRYNYRFGALLQFNFLPAPWCWRTSGSKSTPFVVEQVSLDFSHSWPLVAKGPLQTNFPWPVISTATTLD